MFDIRHLDRRERLEGAAELMRDLLLEAGIGARVLPVTEALGQRLVTPTLVIGVGFRIWAAVPRDGTPALFGAEWNAGGVKAKLVAMRTPEVAALRIIEVMTRRARV
jgi:hypothetical protein